MSWSQVRSQRSRHAHRALVNVAPVLLVLLLLGSAPIPRSAPTQAVQAIPGISDRASLLYADAASAVRRRDCAGAVKALAPLLGGKGREAAFSRLLTGFYAHACEQAGAAEDRLFAAADPDGVLEDWRLYLLADSAASRGHVLLAQTALAKLLGDYPASVLRPRALLKAATVAWQRGDTTRATEMIGVARRENLLGDEGMQIERLAWEMGGRLGDAAMRRDAARRLLTEWPPAAAELKAAEIFRAANGALDLSAVLTPEQLERRARALFALRLDANAAAALDAVPAAGRDLAWTLLRAQAFTRTHQGSDALALLAGRKSTDPRWAAALEWERAVAAEDLATVWPGRPNLAAAERQQMRQQALQSYHKVAQGGDPLRAVMALRVLYAAQVEEDRFDESMETLRRLRRLDPTDTTGAANLWNRGWREYLKRNYSGAVGYWTELYDLYPQDANGRRGRYWTGRAFGALGETERAQQIFREVAASDTTDFYRKNALAHLQKKPAPATGASEAAASEPWPNDPALTRARLLTDLGLEDLALAELQLAQARPQSSPSSQPPQPRAVNALEALILARQGQRRKSIAVIRDAFPALGGAFQASLPEEARRLYYPLEHQEAIRNWAMMNRLPTHLVFGIIRQESAFDANAESRAGARGLMQLMPATARELARGIGLPYSHDRLADPEFNVRLGTTYFSQVLAQFDGNVELALAGYNGGPYRIKRMWRESGGSDVDRFLEGLDLEESKTYVKRILVLSDSYRQLYPLPG